MTRPSWDNYFLDVACLVASRSTCLRRGGLAVLIWQDNGRVTTRADRNHYPRQGGLTRLERGVILSALAVVIGVVLKIFR